MPDPIQVTSTVAFPEPPIHETHTTNGSTDSKPAFSPAQIAEHARSAALSQSEQSGLDARAAHETELARIAADKAAKDLEIQDRLDKQKAAADELHAAKIERQAQILRDANEELKARPAVGLFADQKGWDKTKLAIGLAIAGYGDALLARASATLGHQVGKMDAVSDIINADLDRQREIVKKLSDDRIMAKEGLKDAVDARTQAMARIDLAGAEMFKRAGLATAQQLAAKGIEMPAIAKDEKVLVLQRQEQERRDAAVAPLVEQHTKHRETAITDRTPAIKPDKPASAEAQKLEMQKKRIASNAPDLMTDLPNLTRKDREDIQRVLRSDRWRDKNVTVDALLGEFGADPEHGLSETAKRVLRGASEHADATVTLNTGAVASPDQVRNKLRQVLPGPDATKKDLRNHLDLIKRDLDTYGGAKPAETAPAPLTPPIGSPPAMAPAAAPPATAPTGVPPMLARPPEAAPGVQPMLPPPTLAQAKQAELIKRDPNATQTEKDRAETVLQRWNASRGRQ